ncbi:hypothetical protein [Glutamicibacter nicotianae]|uniref:Transposase IS4-like domain-containing protein n=1 Tax=Glutamicibacter nicotianae TaxID=37929 RepID=A0ABQ0RGF4_GLUNI|nr:hypothetical protein [Glutamicibacter nicotianae]GEC10882.1 hypothetical protein ANI01nite_00850 [Glutamicibacter nicotianae]
MHWVLPYGSFLSAMAGMPIRVLTARIAVDAEGQVVTTETNWLVASLLDPAEGTTLTLMGLRHQRWEIEKAFRELKSPLL